MIYPPKHRGFVCALLFACVSIGSWAQAPSATATVAAATDSASASTAAPVAGSAPAVTAPLSDVRLLIDISGSMKKTDPRNLRRPAVELLARLLPDQSRAGIWTFAQGVDVLMPLAAVDAHWREEAASRAGRIASPGLLTDIGAALALASQPNAPAGYKRHLVLLTDGVVDIGPEAVANLNERRRILGELLPRLKADGYVIHTLALSADADQELMRKLAQASDGVFAVAQTADELMQAFLRIFDQAVPAERLPLVDNSFKVDASIQELTALIFRDSQVPASVLVAPDGREFSASDTAQRLKWHKTANYDLITLREPQPGIWRVKTQMAPNSRVTIVSNLQLQVDPLANQLQQGQALDVAYRFLADGETLANPEFLQLLHAQWQLHPAEAAGEPQALLLTPHNGEFQHRVAAVAQTGDYIFKLHIDGKTFEREFVHRFQVSEAAFSLSQDEQGSYHIRANPALVEPGSASVELTIVHDQQPQAPQPPQLLTASGDWQWHYTFAPALAGPYQLRFHARATGLDGAPVDTWLIKTGQAPEAAADSAVDSLVVNSPVVNNPADVASAAAPGSEATASNSQTTPLWLYIALGVANLLVLILGVVVYRLIAGKGNRTQMQQQESAVAAAVAAPVVIDLADSTLDSTLELPLDLSADDLSASIDALSELNTPENTTALEDDLMDGILPMDDLDDPKDPDTNDKPS